MVDTVNLVNALANHGDLKIVGQNNIYGYIVILESVTSEMSTLNTITTNYLNADFPYIVSETLENGTYKLNRSKE